MSMDNTGEKISVIIIDIIDSIYLTRCINSILHQDYTEIAIYVLENASNYLDFSDEYTVIPWQGTVKETLKNALFKVASESRQLFFVTGSMVLNPHTITALMEKDKDQDVYLSGFFGFKNGELIPAPQYFFSPFGRLFQKEHLDWEEPLFSMYAQVFRDIPAYRYDQEAFIYDSSHSHISDLLSLMENEPDDFEKLTEILPAIEHHKKTKELFQLLIRLQKDSKNKLRLIDIASKIFCKDLPYIYSLCEKSLKGIFDDANYAERTTDIYHFIRQWDEQPEFQTLLLQTLNIAPGDQGMLLHYSKENLEFLENILKRNDLTPFRQSKVLAQDLIIASAKEGKIGFSTIAKTLIAWVGYKTGHTK